MPAPTRSLLQFLQSFFSCKGKRASLVRLQSTIGACALCEKEWTPSTPQHQGHPAPVPASHHCPPNHLPHLPLQRPRKSQKYPLAVCAQARRAARIKEQEPVCFMQDGPLSPPVLHTICCYLRGAEMHVKTLTAGTRSTVQAPRRRCRSLSPHIPTSLPPLIMRMRSGRQLCRQLC